MQKADGFSPLPRPIPIFHRVGCIEDADTYRVVIRVIEHGFPDLCYQKILPGSALKSDAFSHYYDSMLQQLAYEVGRRHGIWICHITPYAKWGLDYPPFDNDPMKCVPSVAAAIRRNAERASHFSPLILLDPELAGADTFEREPFDDKVRASIRPADEAALRARH